MSQDDGLTYGRKKVVKVADGAMRPAAVGSVDDLADALRSEYRLETFGSVGARTGGNE